MDADADDRFALTVVSIAALCHVIGADPLTGLTEPELSKVYAEFGWGNATADYDQLRSYELLGPSSLARAKAQADRAAAAAAGSFSAELGFRSSWSVASTLASTLIAAPPEDGAAKKQCWPAAALPAVL